MGTFHSRIRLTAAVAGLLAAGGVVLYARSLAEGLPMKAAEALGGASNGLVIAAALYAANWVIAWVYRESWPVTLARSLVFAVVAYVGLSNLIDLFGENREVIWQILGREPASDAVAISALRARAMCSVCVMGLSAIAIGLGFEPRRS